MPMTHQDLKVCSRLASSFNHNILKRTGIRNAMNTFGNPPTIVTLVPPSDLSLTQLVLGLILHSHPHLHLRYERIAAFRDTLAA
jgi:hypothetical protein